MITENKYKMTAASIRTNRDHDKNTELVIMRGDKWTNELNSEREFFFRTITRGK